ncbi:MAG TPA: phosphopentomutase [Vicinamibacterales bacterium]|nr:phosphopentomutase [Vicinamibacterales bacterium]
MTISSIPRVILLVLDSVGIGELPDAHAYGDGGSDTLGNICRQVRVQVPTLQALGLGCIAPLRGIPPAARPAAAFGRMAERSAGKDSVTGHWEMMGLVLERPFPTFPHGFPRELIDRFEHAIGRPTIGNVVASGTQIIDELGPEHLRSGAPIVYTSADSVFQIAAHEDVIAVPELYRICGIAYELAVEGLGIGRVIARPFVGKPGHFTRTANRHDFAMAPRGETLLDRLTAADVPVVGIGKVPDLFAGRGVSRAVHTSNDDEVMTEVIRALADTPAGLVFANFVDFDTQYGHRNDVTGYAANLERFDARLPELLRTLAPTDVLAITADHGNDPTTPSTDHSREHVPLLVCGGPVRAGTDLGTRTTFADLGQTLAEVFAVPALAAGTSFLAALRQEAA